jgi:RNA-directed DNA polymerase
MVKRQVIRRKSSPKVAGQGEAREATKQGAETMAAATWSESLASNERLMEEVLERNNLKSALNRVVKNGGSAGIDGMTVDQLPKYLKEHWPRIKEELLSSRYLAHPVKRVEIPKPEGGVRKLGIPTVLDRFIQQALMQVLQSRWDETFSEQSYGFRPGRSAHQAVAKAQEYIEQGYSWVVDIDLEKFFDRVNHHRLMSRVAERVKDERVLRLIQNFLNSGVMENGLVSPTIEGTPQGGPLSPLLSNLVLDELDGELTRRGLRFVRYADDANIYVKSERAGRRVLESITCYISDTLRLKVNSEKSALDRPWNRNILGFSFAKGRDGLKRKPAAKSITRLKEKIRKLTSRTQGRSVEQVVAKLSTYLTGWRGYYGFSQVSSIFRELDSWIKRRLRCMIWKQWGKRRYRELKARGVRLYTAWVTTKSGHGPWRISHSPAVQQALNAKFFRELGLPSLVPAR